MKKRTPWPDFVAYTPPTNEGDGHIMALKIGAAMSVIDVAGACAMRVPGEEHMGKPLYRLSNLQIATPGTIMVNRDGKRFCNESLYTNMKEMMESYDCDSQSYRNIPSYVVFDQWHKDNYLVGITLPDEEAPGWIHRGKTLRELAEKLGVHSGNLEDTVARFNRYASKGEDPDFHRGERAIHRFYGDPLHKPNACLAPIEHPPFYGHEIFLGSAGTRSGLVIDGKARVIDVDRNIIPGLYACPNTAAPLAAGRGYTSGLSLGQSMVFGHIAAQNATA